MDDSNDVSCEGKNVFLEGVLGLGASRFMRFASFPSSGRPSDCAGASGSSFQAGPSHHRGVSKWSHVQLPGLNFERCKPFCHCLWKHCNRSAGSGDSLIFALQALSLAVKQDGRMGLGELVLKVVAKIRQA